MWLGSPEETILDSTCALRAQDKGTAPAAGTGHPREGTLRSLLSPAVPYEIFRADHSCLVSVLPVNASVRDVLRALAPRLGRDREREHVLVKVNSAGGEGAPRGGLVPVASRDLSPPPSPFPARRQSGAAAGRRGSFHSAGAQREALRGQQGRAGQPGECGWGPGWAAPGRALQRGSGLWCLGSGCPRVIPQFGGSLGSGCPRAIPRFGVSGGDL